jgi:Pectate lyase superfamily protein
MAKKKISQLVDALDLDGSELIPVVQGGVTKKTTVNKFGSNFVPLGGTNVGKEVTGPIVAKNPVGDLSTKFYKIISNDGATEYFYVNGNGEAFFNGNVEMEGVTDVDTLEVNNIARYGTAQTFTNNRDIVDKEYIDKKLSWTNVKFFGAVGDGVTDDSTAIQTAINSLAAPGGTLYFPAGNYAIGTAIQPKDGIYMYGDGVKLNFSANCPDLAFTINGGTYFTPIGGLEYCIKTNAVDSPGASSGIKALANVNFKDFGVKGFKYPIKIGAVNQLGMGMGGFHNIIIDGTASDNTTVVTQQGIELYNAQQLHSSGVYLYNVRNGLKIVNNKETPQCSSGNSLWDKVYVYMHPSTVSENIVSITGITTGTKTIITTATAHQLKVGDIFQLNGVTGTDAGIFSRVLKVSVVDSATQIQTDLTSTGKTIIATGTLEKGRVGIHLVAEGTEPLNHITFVSPQVNAFLSSSNPNKAIVNVAICGTLTSRAGAISFIKTDTEGLTDGHFYLDGVANSSIDIATVINTFPFGHMSIYNTDSLIVNGNDVDFTIKIGDFRYSDGNNNIQVNGYVKTFLTNSRFPSYGMWRTVESSVTKSYIGADSVAPAFVLDNTTSGIAKSISDTWKPFRIMEKRDTAKLSGTASISIDRCGFYEATNIADAIVTLPKVGTGANEAKVGVPFAIEKKSGAGKINIVSADSTQKVAGVLSSAGGYELSAVAGSSITLMATGFDSWMFVGGRNL